MKFIVTLLLSLFIGTAFATESAEVAEKQTLKCRSLDKDPNFDLKTIEMVPPGSGDSTGPEWIAQTITIHWNGLNEDGEPAKLSEDIKMKVKKLDERMSTLNGSLKLGIDYGDASFYMFYDYDGDDVIVLIDTATDGPIGKEVHRCEIKK